MTLGSLFGSKNFCMLLPVSWEVFVFHGYWLDPLGGEVLHNDCISMIVSRFTTFTEYDSANTSSARVLWFWSSGRSRNSGLSGSGYKHCVYPNRHFSWASKIVLENSRVSLCVQELFHTRDSLWIFATIPVLRNDTGLPYLFVILIFYLVFGLWLVHSTTLLMSQKNTGLSVLFYPHFRLTRLLEVIWMINFLSRSRECWSRRAWGSLGMIHFLSWRCHGCWGRHSWGRTRW